MTEYDVQSLTEEMSPYDAEVLSAIYLGDGFDDKMLERMRIELNSGMLSYDALIEYETCMTIAELRGSDGPLPWMRNQLSTWAAKERQPLHREVAQEIIDAVNSDIASFNGTASEQCEYLMSLTPRQIAHALSGIDGVVVVYRGMSPDGPLDFCVPKVNNVGDDVYEKLTDDAFMRMVSAYTYALTPVTVELTRFHLKLVARRFYMGGPA